MLTDDQRKRAFNAIIVTQCLGMLMSVIFQNGFYLNYFTKLGVSSPAIAMLFAVPPLLSAFLLLPFAIFSDRMGKKRLALAGQVLLIASLLLVMSAGWVGGGHAMRFIVASLLVYCVGGSLQGASWFALLNPIIPKEIRGRFFGRLRVTFMSVSIVFTLLVTRVLKFNESMWVFQLLLGIVLIAALLRFFTYSRIPELEDTRGDRSARPSFRQACAQVVAVPGYIQFNGYVFLITLFTSAVPVVFGLMQKDVFLFVPSQIMLVGNLFLGGSVAGCWLGGRIVDRYGTRVVFLFAHISYAGVILSMLARHWVPWPLIVHAGACSFLFSMVGATAGVAITSEVLALIPTANKSLSTAINISLFNLAAAFSVMFVSRSIGWNILSSEWRMFSRDFTAYDTLLLAFGTLMLLMLATIGLVPKIAKKTQLMPGSGYPRI